MKILKKTDRYELIASYEDRQIPKSAGWRWDPGVRRWYTDSASTALRLRDQAQPQGWDWSDLETQHETAQTASRAATSDISVPAPEGRTYLQYQLAGIAYASQRAHTLIADEMGLGKTIQAIGLINNRPELQQILIVCPASLKKNWAAEISRWLVTPRQKIVITNYEALKKLEQNQWDLAIFDESHYLKNPKSQRTKLALGITAAKKLFLTGTPILNRPIELYPVLNSAGFGPAKNWFHYARRYCGGKQGRFGWEVAGATNQAELGELLRESLMIRRLKADVLTELPAKRYQIITLDAPAKNLAAERARVSELLERVGADDLDQLQAAYAGIAELAGLRQESALLKAPQIIEDTAEIVDSAGCALIFAHHKIVVSALVDGLRAAKTESGVALRVESITGETPVEARQGLVDRFQAGEIDVLVCSIRAAGVGLTLTRCSNVLFAELDWTPAALQQAEDRCHRIGQAQSVSVRWYVYDGTVDGMLAKCLTRKSEVFAGIFNN